MTSTTSDPAIAQRFIDLRRGDGTEHRGHLPEGARRFACDLGYPFEGDHRDGPLFKAAAMEDKWDLFLYDSRLYATRSWSGQLEIVGDLLFASGEVRLRSVSVSPAQADDPRYPVRLTDFLIKRHLYGAVVPHPLPADLPEDFAKIVAFSFSVHGRHAAYASFEDTTAVRLPLGEAGALGG